MDLGSTVTLVYTGKLEDGTVFGYATEENPMVFQTGMDMAIPQSSTLTTQETASDATRRNFAETFGRVAERTINKNLDVQPTLEIRPGYQFDVLVDQDMAFPAAYGK